MIKKELVPHGERWEQLVSTLYDMGASLGYPVLRWEAEMIEEGTYPFALRLGLRRDFINPKGIEDYLKEKYKTDDVSVVITQEPTSTTPGKVEAYVRNVRVGAWILGIGSE